MNQYQGYDLTALCLWREARGEGVQGMQAVANVIVNRANRDGSTCDAEIMKPLQFSSMTAKGDPQLLLFPHGADAMWVQARGFAARAKAQTLADITQGSTMYYAPAALTGKNVAAIPIVIDGIERPFPRGWDMSKVKFQVAIVRQLYFTEVA